MKKRLCGFNRYEITVKKNPRKAIKTHWKAEKQVRRANFVSKWYVIHMIYGLNRYEIKKTREQPGFSLFLEKKRPTSSPIVAFERQSFCPENHQNK